MSEPTGPAPTDRPAANDLDTEEVHTTPRWVYVSAVVAAVLVLAFAILHLSGGGFGHSMGGHG